MTTYHGAYSGASALKLRYNSVMARGDVVIANSQFTADTIARLYPEARDRLRVIPRGTDLRAFSPAAVDRARVARLREAWGVAPHERVVLVAARLTAWKGQKILVEAARLLHAQGLEDVRYILAGDAQGRDGYVKELDALIQKSGLEGVVSRVGHCDDMPAALDDRERARRALDRARGVRARRRSRRRRWARWSSYPTAAPFPRPCWRPRKRRPKREPAGAFPPAIRRRSPTR